MVRNHLGKVHGDGTRPYIRRTYICYIPCTLIYVRCTYVEMYGLKYYGQPKHSGKPGNRMFRFRANRFRATELIHYLTVYLYIYYLRYV